jgi:hypothetical protein
MYMHIHICIYIYMYIYIYVYVYVYIYIYRTDYTVYKTFSPDENENILDNNEENLLDNINPIETFGSYENLIKKDYNRFKNLFSNKKNESVRTNGAVRPYHSMRNVDHDIINDNIHYDNNYLNSSNRNNNDYHNDNHNDINENKNKLNTFKITKNKKIMPQKRNFSSISASINKPENDIWNSKNSKSENKTEKDMKIITYSSSYTIVPTYECFNVCTYCNFRYVPTYECFNVCTYCNFRYILCIFNA